MKHLPRGRGKLQGHQGKLISAMEGDKNEKETGLKVSCTARSSKVTLLTNNIGSQCRLLKDLCSRCPLYWSSLTGGGKNLPPGPRLPPYEIPRELYLPTQALHHPSPTDRGSLSCFQTIEGFLVEKPYATHTPSQVPC